MKKITFKDLQTATMAEWVEAMGFLSHDEAWCAGGRGFASRP
jgi:hypothetical protein